MAKQKYIYRWNDDHGGRGVDPSRGYTEADVWAWAIKWLRPSTMKDDAEAERFIRQHGEVVPLQAD